MKNFSVVFADEVLNLVFVYIAGASTYLCLCVAVTVIAT